MGWRATFVLLTVLTVPIFIGAIVILPESLHYLVAQKLLTISPQIAKDNEKLDIDVHIHPEHGEHIVKLSHIKYITQTRFMRPWEPLHFIIDMELFPYYLVSMITFGT